MITFLRVESVAVRVQPARQANGREWYLTGCQTQVNSDLAPFMGNENLPAYPLDLLPYMEPL